MSALSSDGLRFSVAHPFCDTCHTFSIQDELDEIDKIDVYLNIGGSESEGTDRERFSRNKMATVASQPRQHSPSRDVLRTFKGLGDLCCLAVNTNVIPVTSQQTANSNVIS